MSAFGHRSVAQEPGILTPSPLPLRAVPVRRHRLEGESRGPSVSRIARLTTCRRRRRRTGWKRSHVIAVFGSWSTESHRKASAVGRRSGAQTSNTRLFLLSLRLAVGRNGTDRQERWPTAEDAPRRLTRDSVGFQAPVAHVGRLSRLLGCGRFLALRATKSRDGAR